MNTTPLINLQAGVAQEFPIAYVDRIVVLLAPGPLLITFPDLRQASYLYPGTRYTLPRAYGKLLNSGSFFVACNSAGPLVLGLLQHDEDVEIPGGIFTPPYSFPTESASIVLTNEPTGTLDNITIPVLGFTELSVMGLYNINPANVFWINGLLDAHNFSNGYVDWSTSVNPPLRDFKGVVYDDGAGAHSILANRTITTINVAPFSSVRAVLRNSNLGDSAMLSYKLR